MKKLAFIITLMVAFTRLNAQENFITKSGNVSIISTTPNEDIRYENFEVVSDDPAAAPIKDIRSEKNKVVMDHPMAVLILPGQENGTFNLYYAQEQEQAVKVKIYNSSRTLVHEERIKSEGGFKRPYDLGDLDPGEYIFEIQDANSKISRQVLYRDSKPSIRLEKIDEDRFRLIVSNTQAKNLTVFISDNYNNLIYTDHISNNGGFMRTYNLSQVKVDKVHFQVKDNYKILGNISN